ncbi:MAG TPA: putative peptidoglycan binding domain-containing protein, partial [Acidimicrobiia bacterium]|nr:putative peptidoglycan binding domain-containing protein [Acidimicrobiia bacterium]
WLDLRIDHSDNPIEDLLGLLDLHKLYFGRTESGDLLPFDEALRLEVQGLLDSIGWWDPEETPEDNLQNWLGWHNLEERWAGAGSIDPVVLGELRKTPTA